jgi:hypothetical protein
LPSAPAWSSIILVTIFPAQTDQLTRRWKQQVPPTHQYLRANLHGVTQWLRWSRGSMLAFGTQVRGFTPGRSRRISRAKKSSAHLPSEGEVKPSVPCRSFTACKRSLDVTWKSAFRQTFLAHSSTFRHSVLSRGDTHGDAWWRKLERLTQIAH